MAVTGRECHKAARLKRHKKKLKSSITLKVRDVPRALVPITFHDMPFLVHEIWQYMHFVNTAGFRRLDTNENYEVFLKCVLVLCQAELVYTHRCVAGFKSPLCKLMDENEHKVLWHKWQQPYLFLLPFCLTI